MKVLLAVDDSEFSDVATQAVLSQYRPDSTEVEVLNVVDLELPIPTSYAGGFRRESLHHGTEIVQRTGQSLSKAGFTVRTTVEEGNPKAKILDEAARWHPDVIVLGSHGRTGAQHFLMGSVSEAVARHAHCSVEIARASNSR